MDEQDALHGVSRDVALAGATMGSGASAEKHVTEKETATIADALTLLYVPDRLPLHLLLKLRRKLICPEMSRVTFTKSPQDLTRLLRILRQSLRFVILA